MAKTPYASAAWAPTRLAVLQRDGRVCQIKGPKCTGEATAVDHIKPWRDGGEWFDPRNLRAACLACNSSRATKQKHHLGWKRSKTEIVLVEPGRAGTIETGPGGLIISAESIVDAMGCDRRTAEAVYRILVRELRRGELKADRVFLVDDAGEPDLPYHRVENERFTASSW